MVTVFLFKLVLSYEKRLFLVATYPALQRIAFPFGSAFPVHSLTFEEDGFFYPCPNALGINVQVKGVLPALGSPLHLPEYTSLICGMHVPCQAWRQMPQMPKHGVGGHSRCAPVPSPPSFWLHMQHKGQRLPAAGSCTSCSPHIFFYNTPPIKPKTHR